MFVSGFVVVVVDVFRKTHTVFENCIAFLKRPFKYCSCCD